MQAMRVARRCALSARPALLGLRANGTGAGLDYDIVIAGAGSAGCVLAARLSEDPRNRVLLIEAGGRDDYPWIHIPIGYLYCIGNPRTDWMYRTAPEPGLGGRSLLYPRGRVLGGCSSINGMLYVRGQSADYDGWRQMGCTGWGWDDVQAAVPEVRELLCRAVRRSRRGRPVAHRPPAAALGHP